MWCFHCRCDQHQGSRRFHPVVGFSLSGGGSIIFLFLFFVSIPPDLFFSQSIHLLADSSLLNSAFKTRCLSRFQNKLQNRVLFDFALLPPDIFLIIRIISLCYSNFCLSNRKPSSASVVYIIIYKEKNYYPYYHWPESRVQLSPTLWDDDFNFAVVSSISFYFFLCNNLVCVVLFVPQLLSYPPLLETSGKDWKNLYRPFRHTHDTALSFFIFFTRLLNKLYIFCPPRAPDCFLFLSDNWPFSLHPPICSFVGFFVYCLAPLFLRGQVYIGICFW